MVMKFKQLLDYNIYRFKYRFGKSLKLTAPVDVSLELASVCNQHCSYCYHADPDNLQFKTGIMSKAVAFQIIIDAYENHVPSLKFNWKGESTINPHFNEITAYARKIAHGPVFIDRITNSNFKFRTDREDIFEGLCNQTKVKVSYDSFDKKVFEIQRSGGDHELTTRNIDKFYNHPLRKNTDLVIQAVRTQLNKDEDLEGMAKRRWPSATLSVREVVAGRKEQDIEKLENQKRDSSCRQSCLQAHVRIIFNHDGEAFPCCPVVDESLPLGNIKKKSIHEIFNGWKAEELRRQLKSKEAFTTFNACKGCSSFESYKNFKPSWNS